LRWAFGVLDLGPDSRTIAGAQSKYRILMRKMHPDKVGHLPGMEKAVEAVREAKSLCESKLSRQEPPGQPRSLRSSAMCCSPGKRRIRVEWSAPPACESAPVRRYIVAAFDPSYGRALTVTVLEPDYSEELRRYISIDELDHYVLAEEDLQKMPNLFKQAAIELQIAAANEAGQSSWAPLRVPIVGMVVPPASTTRTAVARGVAATAAASAGAARGGGVGAQSAAASGSRSAAATRTAGAAAATSAKQKLKGGAKAAAASKGNSSKR